MAAKNLSARLDALADLTRIGRHREGTDGFAADLLDNSETLLRRAGERLRLSANHTVVALAGGTGSGKSTLFNALSGPARPP
jgi:predicted GTPase